jgi:long-chain acyl-CoA synthetase
MTGARANGEDTVPTMFWARVLARGERTALREKDYGIWRGISWAEFGERARAVGLGLVSLGLAPGDKVCVLSENNPEWLYCDMGVLGAGAVTSGIYPTDSLKQVAYIVNNCEARFIFVEDEEQLDKVLEARAAMPTLEKVFVFDMEGLRGFADELVTSFDELLALGARTHEENPGLWDELIRTAAPDDLAILVYTSGTTGPPKGAMISHHNIVFQARHSQALLPMGENDERVSFLPLCHVAERGAAYLAIYAGTTINFAESVDTLAENLREVQPTSMIAVPRVWEKFYSARGCGRSSTRRSPSRWPTRRGCSGGRTARRSASATEWSTSSSRDGRCPPRSGSPTGSPIGWCSGTFAG